MADLDGDGRLDLFSGSYKPGDIYWFRRGADHGFHAGEVMADAGGDPLRAATQELGEAEAAAAAQATTPWLVDLDFDGDLDLLVGNIGGDVIEFQNVGTRTEPAFENVGILEAGGTPVTVHSDAGPEVVDWDGDGHMDLLVGSGDGAVLLYPGLPGNDELMEFGAGQVLLGVRGEQPHIWRPGQTQNRPAARAKAHAIDWNGDGRLDLVVGDYAVRERARRKLTEEESARLASLRQRRDALREDLNALGDSETNEAAREAVDSTLREVVADIGALASGGFESVHGVWVYLRKP